ncbi:hypothetical protein SSYRP_v1c05010 [Spiroplasma syrphidicola EA-1]|uniref:Uncharacterized protein n=1 Tax=Spiroplasma syrphidicola EA-1 TaxID=1276229 RepID=R4U661_9MOLU|nr:hypothetical protein [Spiroplasma syrphidicola]AGM26093.1 hypothetical protein SSYRP_v1c05010 [Spiroplasma syrphidicola EA-1]
MAKTPTFCSVHLKIHVCPLNNKKAIASANETKIKEKMSRMLNPTSSQPPEPNKQEAEKGTIQFLLANAKKKNNAIKHNLGLDEEEKMSEGVSETDIKSKMAKLRANIGLNETAITPTPNSEMALDSQLESYSNIIEENTSPNVNNETIDVNSEQPKQKGQRKNGQKKVVSAASKQKNVDNTQLDANKIPEITDNINGEEKTIVLTKTEVEEMIAKAVEAALKKSEKNKK